MTVVTSTIQVTVDEQIKVDATACLARFGMTVPEAVRILLTRVAREGAESVGLVGDQDSYDKWLCTQVQEAMDDPSPFIPHEQVMVEMQAIIDEKRYARSEMA